MQPPEAVEFLQAKTNNPNLYTATIPHILKTYFSAKEAMLWHIMEFQNAINFLHQEMPAVRNFIELLLYTVSGKCLNSCTLEM